MSQHGTAWHRIAQHGTARPQHGPAWHCMAQYCRAWHSTAQLGRRHTRESVSQKPAPTCLMACQLNTTACCAPGPAGLRVLKPNSGAATPSSVLSTAGSYAHTVDMSVMNDVCVEPLSVDANAQDALVPVRLCSISGQWVVSDSCLGTACSSLSTM